MEFLCEGREEEDFGFGDNGERGAGREGGKMRGVSI